MHKRSSQVLRVPAQGGSSGTGRGHILIASPIDISTVDQVQGRSKGAAYFGHDELEPV